MGRQSLISRLAVALVLAGGTSATLFAPVALAAKKEAKDAPKISYSPEFAKAAAEIDKTLATPSPAVTAATQKASAATAPADKQAAIAQVDAALGGGKAKIDAAAAIATTPGDKLKAGDMYRMLGNAYSDAAIQHKGMVMMLDSGGLQPDQISQLQWLAGVTAYQSGDYVEALKYLKPAHDAGYKDSQGLLDQVLADSYQRTGNAAGAAQVATQEIAQAKAAGTKPSEAALRSALQASYDAKDLAASADLAAELARDYPAPATWSTSISVVRDLAKLQNQDNLDLMRLMFRTDAMTTRNDYFEYIDNADPRRLPGETVKVIDAGLASGKLQSSDKLLGEMRQLASSKIAADRASLGDLEKYARSPKADAATVSGAADAYLSYGQPASAEDLYKLALTKPGIDKDRALIRLGIAQTDGGKVADAIQTFQQVSGPRASVAKLWIAYANSKSAAAPAATPSQ